MLRTKRTERQWKEDGLLPRPCLLHRLDKDTSGIVALARTARSRRHLIRQFHEHTVVKRYLAVVQKGASAWSYPRTKFTVTKRENGKDEVLAAIPPVLLCKDELILDGPLQRDPADRRRCIVGPEGQVATTVLKVLAVSEKFALLEVRPVTGRTHQIRAHLAALGYAIVGDQVYAPQPELGTPQAALKRQFLHAHSLEIRRYPDNALCTFVAPLADDLSSWMNCYFPMGSGVIDASSHTRTVPA
jgi:23S rRNA-/tRNA-specific pseudouridylate synthase